ncbi:MAG: pyridoxal-phosphate dependent enzyme [Flavobacteriales bacterium]|jgi:cystathionine beta-synthase
MNYHENILGTIGSTPLVKINRITEEIPALVLAKIESVNPGNSIKDRMALKMIEDAERSGALKPGSTIIEGTSGNTGMGLAIASVIKGYKCIFTSTDKQSKEKFDALRAFGAEVIVCPTNVDPEDPRSYYSVSSRLVNEVPNSWKANQYDNPSNAQAHYETTGPEIWKQTEGKITHLVVGVGTGGTICGVARYLKEKNPNIQILGIDTYGSVFKKLKETGEFDKNEIYPYITEGIGEDFVPQNVNLDLIDYFEKVTDKDAAVMTRRIAREEGIFAGNSAGSAMAGLMQMKDRFKQGDVVVVIFHDHGTRYLGKMYNDEWMRDRGFLQDEKKTARDLVAGHLDKPLVMIGSGELVSHAADKMKKFGISQIPVMKDDAIVGFVDETRLYQSMVEDPQNINRKIETVMGPALPVVGESEPITSLSKLISRDVPAVLVKLNNGKYHIITKYDIIQSLS